jgi:hypothetical protein
MTSVGRGFYLETKVQLSRLIENEILRLRDPTLRQAQGRQRDRRVSVILMVSSRPEWSAFGGVKWRDRGQHPATPAQQKTLALPSG